MACPRIVSFTDCKDPNSNLPYSFDWSDWLANEAATLVDNVANRVITISLVDDTEIDALPLTAGTITTDVAQGKIFVWLTGGTVDLQYYLACRITASNGMIEEKTGIITIVEK